MNLSEAITDSHKKDLRLKFGPSVTPRYCSQCFLAYTGFLTDIVERKVGLKSSDLFGCFDLIAVGHGQVIGVQVSTHGHAQPHIDKMLAEPRLKIWLANGGVAELQTFNRTRTTLRRGFFTLGKDGEPAYEETYRGKVLDFLDKFDGICK